MSVLGCVFNLGESTIRNTVRSADKICAAVIQSSSLSSKITTKVCNPILEKMEKLLCTLTMKIQRKVVLNAMVRFKVLRIYEHLCHEAGDNALLEPILASKGCFARFMKQ